MRLLAEIPPPQITWPALRIGLALLSSAITALGLRRGAHGFLNALAHAIFNAPTQTFAAIQNLVFGAQKGAADDALLQQYKIAAFYYRLATLMGFSVFTIRYLSEHLLGALKVLRQQVVPSVARTAAAPAIRSAGRARKATRTLHRDAAIGDAAVRREINVLKGGLAAVAADVATFPGVIGREIRGLHVPRVLRRLSKLEKILAAAGLGVLVLRGLGKESCGWSCQRQGRRFGKFLHRIPRTLLNALFEGAVDVLVVRELCLIVQGMTIAARAAAPIFDHVATMTEELIQCRKAERPGLLPVTYYSPPPALSSLPLTGG